MKIRVDRILELLERQMPAGGTLSARDRRVLSRRLDLLDGQIDGDIKVQDHTRVFKVLDSYVRLSDSTLKKLWADPAKNYRARGDIRSYMTGCVRVTKGYRLRVKAFRVADSDGSRQARVTPENAQQWIDYANDIFRRSRVSIELVFDQRTDWRDLRDSEVNRLYWKDTKDADGRKRAEKIAERFSQDVVVFFPWGTEREPDEYATAAYLTERRNSYIKMPGRDMTEDRPATLAHELGHYLGLPHPFPWNPESGTDDLTDTYDKAAAYLREHGHLDGDGFADTPWDAGRSYYVNTVSGDKCDPGHVSYEIEGQTIMPDRHNMMGYFYCGNETVSPQQRERMYETIQQFQKGEEGYVTVKGTDAPSCSALNQALATLAEEAAPAVKWQALDIMAAQLDAATASRRWGLSDHAIAALAPLVRADPSLAVTLMVYLSNNWHRSSFLTGRTIIRSIRKAGVLTPAILPELHDLSHRSFVSYNVEGLMSDIRAHEARGFLLGTAPVFSQRFAGTGTGESRIISSTIGPDGGVEKEEIRKRSAETGGGFQIEGHHRLRNGQLEWVEQVGLLTHQDFAATQSISQVNLQTGLNFFVSGYPGGVEIYIGLRAGVFHRFSDSVTGFSVSPLLPVLVGFRAPLGEHFYFDTSAALLVDVIPEQKNHQDQRAANLYGSIGVLYHYR